MTGTKHRAASLRQQTLVRPVFRPVSNIFLLLHKILNGFRRNSNNSNRLNDYMLAKVKQEHRNIGAGYERKDIITFKELLIKSGSSLFQNMQ